MRIITKQDKKYVQNNLGFSLMEVLITVAIIGIIGGIATVKLGRYMRAGKATEAKVMLSNLYNAEKIYRLEHENFHYDLKEIGLDVTGEYIYNVGFQGANPIKGDGDSCPGDGIPPGCSNTKKNYNIFNLCGSAIGDDTGENKDCSLSVGGVAVASSDVKNLTKGTDKCGGKDAKVTKSGGRLSGFLAIACADLGGSQLDVWSINHVKQLKEEQDGT